MKRLLIVEFTKMEGAGNDFIVLDNRFFHFSPKELGEIATRFCQRRTGIGADGLLALENPDGSDADFRMRYRNADGSRGTMCGNGARCIALFAQMAGVAGRRQTFETDAGLYRSEVGADGTKVRIWMPRPLPELPEETIPVTLASGYGLELHKLWTGTEHVVAFVDNLDDLDVQETGRRIRFLPQFRPEGTNVNFVQLRRSGENEIEVRARTYEKGVESETLACGTGAVAIALASLSQGHISGTTIDVHMPGGILTIGLTKSDDAITGLYLEGEARQVFRGTFQIQ